MNDQLTEDQWQQFERDGYLRLGKVLSKGELAALQQRMNDIMLGRADLNYDRTLMQRDSDTGLYGDVGPANRGFKGATLNYRKIEDLEFDSLFLSYMQRPLFRHICERVYGDGTPVTAYRAMFMNKPAGKGTFLPWHQDRWTDLDRDPLITIWTALDPATVANGCMQIVNNSHTAGLLNPDHPSGFVTPEQAQKMVTENGISFLEVSAGEAVLLHNWLLHSSDVNRTEIPRRAFSVCYMDGRTVARSGRSYSVIFGEGALSLP